MPKKPKLTLVRPQETITLPLAYAKAMDAAATSLSTLLETGLRVADVQAAHAALDTLEALTDTLTLDQKRALNAHD